MNIVIDCYLFRVNYSSALDSLLVLLLFYNCYYL